MLGETRSYHKPLSFGKAVQSNRQIMAMSVYGLVVIVAYVAAYFLRFEFRLPVKMTSMLMATLPVLVVVRLTSYWLFGLSMGRWRFIATTDALRLAGACLNGSIVFFLIMRVLDVRVPNSVILIEAVLTTNITAAIWLSYRATFERLRLVRSPDYHHQKRVLIVGAGEAGIMLAREMLRFPTGYKPIAFVDDDPLKWNTTLHGLLVRGGTRNLARLHKELQIDEIILAMPSASPSELRAVVEKCEQFGCPFKVLPGIAQVLAGSVRLAHLRDVRIEDLLGREPIELELPELLADLRGRTVLITGAAGSIGSELARQIALHDPACMVLFDQAETDLFYLDNELREAHPDVDVRAVVGDIVDPHSVDCVFEQFAPDRIYHAAAYKHVPLMEANPWEATRNNVLGTWHVASAAGRFRSEKFVLVSTDKAVRPSSVMGATKRVAEIIVTQKQLKYPKTTFAAVRFGNVLGSNGSVLPLFKKQLAARKPLTVTHPDVTRFFMTIPEAVQLILQASLLPEVRGSIAMLDMGNPIPIVDLARNLLSLSDADHRGAIVYTGLRPGEKLHEELAAPEEETIRTAIEKVRVIRTNFGLMPDLAPLIRAIELGQKDQVLHLMSAWFPGLSMGPISARTVVKSHERVFALNDAK